MSTRSVYDTPPNGDFARYVEELGQQSAARLLAASGAASASTRGAGARAARPAPSEAAPAARGPGFKPVRQMLQLGFVLWIAYTVGTALFPPLAVIGWPLLVFFIVATAARFKSLPWSDLAQAARHEAEQKIRPSSGQQ